MPATQSIPQQTQAPLPASLIYPLTPSQVRVMLKTVAAAAAA